MSNSTIITNTATLALQDTDYILTVALLINNASNGTSNNTSNDVFNLTLIEGNNIVSNSYLQSVLTTNLVTNSYLQFVLGSYASNTQLNTDLSDLDGGSF